MRASSHPLFARCSHAVRTLFARCSRAVRVLFVRARTHPRTTRRARLPRATQGAYHTHGHRATATAGWCTSAARTSTTASTAAAPGRPMKSKQVVCFISSPPREQLRHAHAAALTPALTGGCHGDDLLKSLYKSLYKNAKIQSISPTSRCASPGCLQASRASGKFFTARR